MPRASQDALVDALEAAAEQGDAGAGSQRPGTRLVEAAAAGREAEDGPAHRPVRRRRVQRRRDHVGAHHHPCAAAGRGVVDGAVAVGRGVADVADLEPPEVVGERPAEQRRAEGAGEHLREQGEDAGGPGGSGHCHRAFARWAAKSVA